MSNVTNIPIVTIGRELRSENCVSELKRQKARCPICGKLCLLAAFNFWLNNEVWCCQYNYVISIIKQIRQKARRQTLGVTGGVGL